VGQPRVFAWFDNISSAGKMPAGPTAKIAVLLRRDALRKVKMLRSVRDPYAFIDTIDGRRLF